MHYNWSTSTGATGCTRFRLLESDLECIITEYQVAVQNRSWYTGSARRINDKRLGTIIHHDVIMTIMTTLTSYIYGKEMP